MKKTIDKYFTENYDYLIELAESAINNSNRPYGACELVSYAYERSLVMYQYGDVGECVCNIILRDCYWNNSYVNREILLTQTPFEKTQDINIVPDNEDNDEEILEKVMLEKWYNDKKSALELYRRKIAKDKPKLIVLDKMIKLKTRNSRQLAEVFAIPHTTMYLMVREIQDELREFEEDINNYDNKNVNNR